MPKHARHGLRVPRTVRQLEAYLRRKTGGRLGFAEVDQVPVGCDLVLNERSEFVVQQVPHFGGENSPPGQSLQLEPVREDNVTEMIMNRAEEARTPSKVFRLQQITSTQSNANAVTLLESIQLFWLSRSFSSHCSSSVSNCLGKALPKTCWP